jgi:FRG domain-containing protein
LSVEEIILALMKKSGAPMQIAAEFFQSIDVNKRLKLDSAGDLWEWIEGGGTEGLVSDPWVLNAGQDTFFRGQASAQYGISSKLYRDCLTAAKSAGRTDIAESDLAAAERVILNAMGEEGIGRRMSEGEMLMVLQHHGIATRLLDVSASPKEALFFACDQHGEQGGRFFVFSLAPDGSLVGQPHLWP